MATRRQFLARTCLAAAAAGLGRAALGTPRKPNIVLLFADDLGWGDVGFQRPIYQTPNIDRLAAESLVFTDAYAASPTCSPSRASTITGRHAARLHLVRHIGSGTSIPPENEFAMLDTDPAHFPSRNWLPLEETTMGEALQTLGYQTGFAGKWHLGPEAYFPDKQGYRHTRGVTDQGHPGSYLAPFWPKAKTVYDNVPEGAYLTDCITDDAIDLIHTMQGAQPFLLNVFYYGVHMPWKGRPDLEARAEAQGFTGAQRDYAAVVMGLDESVGRIRHALEAAGIADDTVLVFFSDQGNHLSNAPLRGSKKGGEACYEGGARVPLIVHWPGVTKPGSTCQEHVLSTDLFPTFVEIAGGDTAPYAPLDGLSLMPLLMGRGGFERDAIYLYRSYESQYAVVRAGDWKLIAYRDRPSELFNLREDRSEQHDLASAHPEKLAALEAKLAAWEKEVGVSQY